MNWKDLKVGDVVRIPKYPNCWSSGCVSNCPKESMFPFEGEIKEIKKRSEHTAANIGGYGFDISRASFQFKIIRSSYNYEIY